MNDGTQDQVKVSFPASPAFSRVGRVAVAGLALRLGVDVVDVERLRLAVDHAVTAFHGRGRINLNARWMPNELLITIDNPDRVLDESTTHTIAAALSDVVDGVRVGPTAIDFRLASGANAGAAAHRAGTTETTGTA